MSTDAGWAIPTPGAHEEKLVTKKEFAEATKQIMEQVGKPSCLCLGVLYSVLKRRLYGGLHGRLRFFPRPR